VLAQLVEGAAEIGEAGGDGGPVVARVAVGREQEERQREQDQPGRSERPD